eukprot:gene7508-654_t
MNWQSTVYQRCDACEGRDMYCPSVFAPPPGVLWSAYTTADSISSLPCSTCTGAGMPCSCVPPLNTEDEEGIPQCLPNTPKGLVLTKSRGCRGSSSSLNSGFLSSFASGEHRTQSRRGSLGSVSSIAGRSTERRLATDDPVPPLERYSFYLVFLPNYYRVKTECSHRRSQS